MIKMVAFLDRRKDLSLAQFSHHWRTVHRELALRLVAPGLMHGYIQDHRLDTTIAGIPPPTDGCPEVWVKDLSEIERLQGSPEYLEGAYPDEANFMDGPARVMVTEETVVIPGPGRLALSNAVKILLFFKRKPDRTLGDFANWVHIAHPLLLPAARPLRLARDTAIDDPRVAEIHEYDGMEASWWPNFRSFAAAWENRLPDIAEHWIDTAATSGMPVKEEYVVNPTGAD